MPPMRANTTAPSAKHFLLPLGAGVMLAGVCAFPIPESGPPPPGLVLTEVLQHLESDFVREVDSRELFNDGLDRMLQRLERNTRYIPPREVTAFDG
ncbi:MAG: hypothetical protein V3T77_00585, partial [Planctomycetota bacterium]